MTIEDDIAFFERVPTLGLLGRAALRILAIGAESRYVHSGEVLFNAGEAADGAFVLQEGSFSLATRQSDREPVAVGPGTLLGELALITETTRPVTATALEPSTVLRIPRSLFLKMLEGYPEAARGNCATSWPRATTKRRATSPADRDIAGTRALSSDPQRARGSCQSHLDRRRHRHVVGRPRGAAVVLGDLDVGDAARRARARSRCGRAGGPCRRSPSRARGSSTRCRASPARA